MDVYVGADLPLAQPELLRRLRKGHVGILPTDTIYGLSGDASQPEVVRRIQQIKRRRNPPSLIPPSQNWAISVISPRHRNRFLKLHRKYRGAFTMLWPSASAPLRALLGSRFVGLRFPQHWVGDFAEALGSPLVTTSVNVTKEAPMVDLESLDPGIARLIDFLVYEGPLQGPASSLVWLNGAQPRIVRRS